MLTSAEFVGRLKYPADKFTTTPDTAVWVWQNQDKACTLIAKTKLVGMYSVGKKNTEYEIVDVDYYNDLARLVSRVKG